MTKYEVYIYKGVENSWAVQQGYTTMVETDLVNSHQIADLAIEQINEIVGPHTVGAGWRYSVITEGRPKDVIRHNEMGRWH